MASGNGPATEYSLRGRLLSRTPVVGTFVKTTSPHVVEILGRSGMDFAVLDAEHAPFDISSLDLALMAARAMQFDAIVRIPDHRPAFINSVLDMGAAGIMAPHTRTSSNVDGIANAARYHRGQRGFSPSGRAGSYGQQGHARYRAGADADTTLCYQIEDRDAMERLDEIAANDAVDCLFIGPADLGLSLGCSGPDDPRLIEAIDAIVDAGRRHDRCVGLFVPDAARIPDMIAKGITMFVCGSDQSLLLTGARRIAASVTPGGT